MSRLPNPGGDKNIWGDVLNDFLEQSHNADGSLKSSSVANAGVEVAVNKGAAGGYAPLDGSGLVPAANLPLSTLDIRYQVPAIFSRSGVLTVTAGAGRFYVPYPAVIQGVVAAVGIAPAGADVICDVNLNGSTVFTNQSHRPTITDGTNKIASITVPDILALAAGDLLSVDVDQIGSGTAGSDLTVVVLLAR